MRPEDLHVIVLTRAAGPLHGVGGLERHVHDLLSHLLRRHVTITLITRPPLDGAVLPIDLQQSGRLTVREVPYPTLPFAGRRGTTVLDRSSAYPLFGWRAGRLAAELVRRGGVHLVHGMGAASLGYADARRHDWLGTVPFVFNPHGMEEFGSTGPGLGALKHAAYAPLRRAVRRSASAADRIIATDRVLVPSVMMHLHADPSRIAVIPNAVDLDAVDRRRDAAAAHAIRARAGLGPDDVLLVGVGRLEPNKGFHHAIAAVARLTARPTPVLPAGGTWRFVLLGEGSERPRLAREVAAAGLGTEVLMPGRVEDDDLHAWLEAATLFVHPTLYEGSSIVTLEAMAHARAVVATNAGGIPDKVRPGVNGWLVPPGDTDALAQALTEALNDRARLRTMGANSRAIVVDEFSWAAVMSRLLDLYHEVLAGRRSRSGASSSSEGALRVG